MKLKRPIPASLILFGLSAGIVLYAGNLCAESDQLQALVQESERLDLDTRTVKQIIVQGRERGWSDTTLSQLIGAAVDTARRSLPPHLILEKVEEGLAKHVGSDALISAIHKRADLMITAQEMLNRCESIPGHGADMLIPSLTKAIESGVPDSSLQQLFSSKEHLRPGRLRGAIEGGELLHLAGLSAEQVSTFMKDCLSRDLRRSEVIRAIRFVESQNQQGMTFENIRRSLWHDGMQGNPKETGHGQSVNSCTGEGRAGGPGSPFGSSQLRGSGHPGSGQGRK